MHNIIHEFAIIIAIGIGAQWLAWKIKWPAIVLWMIGGWVSGQVLGWINPEEALGDLFHPHVELASAIILFEGGLSLKYSEFMRAGGGISRLISVGLIIHLLLLTLAGYFIAGWSLEFSLLLGSILIVTGPTVITPMIRQIRLKQRPATFLKWEGIINDPIGALLAVLVFEYIAISGSSAATEVFISSLQAILISGVISFGLSSLLKFAFIKSLIPDYLKVPIVLSLVLVSFAAANQLQEGSGLLAVTLFGLFVGNKDLPIIHEIKKFKESISTFLIAIIFVALSATLEISTFEAIGWREMLYLALVLFALRPIAILTSTIGSGMEWNEKAVISWFAPRGIVAASVAGVLGHKLVEANFMEGEKLVPMVFAVVFLSVFIYGFSIKKLARKLNLVGDSSKGIIVIGDSFWSINFCEALEKMGYHTFLVTTSKSVCRKAMKSGLNSFCGEILQLVMEHKIDFANYFSLMAITENSSYNAIICQNLSEVFGWDSVYQLPLSEEEKNNPHYLPQSLRGRFFPEKLNYEAILHAFECGRGFEVTMVKESEASQKNDQFCRALYKDSDNRLRIFHKAGSAPVGVQSLGLHLPG